MTDCKEASSLASPDKQSRLKQLSDAEWDFISTHYGIHSDDLKRSMNSTQWTELTDVLGDGRLLLGNQIEAAMLPLLERLNVRHVINVASQCDPVFPDRYVTT